MKAEEILLRTSERNDFKRCPWLWEQVWVKGLRRAQEPTWAWFGTAWHTAMEARYPPGKKRGSVKKMKAAFLDAVGEHTGRIWQEAADDLDGDEFEQEIVDAKELGLKMIDGYVEKYGMDSEWEVVHTEQAFQIDVPDPFDPSKILLTYAGTWDALMRHRFTKAWWLWDHKTRKSFPSEGRWNFYDINDQAGSYLWVAPEVLKHLGIFKGDEVIEGLVFNAARKHLPDERPRNADGKATNLPKKIHYVEAIQEFDGKPLVGKYTLDDLVDMAARRQLQVFGDVSARQPMEMFHREEVYREPTERVTQGQRVQAEAKTMIMMRNGELPVWKTPTEDCLRCPMFDYCELDEQDHDAAAALASTMYVKRDPYRDHREDMKIKNGVRV